MADNIPFTPEIWNGEAFPGSQACRDIAPVGLGMSGLSVRVKCTMNGKSLFWGSYSETRIDSDSHS